MVDYIPTKGDRQKTCGAKLCQKHLKTPLHTRQCAICGNSFFAKRTQKFCSSVCVHVNSVECQRAAARAKRVEQQCVICGIIFFPNRRGRTMCGSICRQLWGRKYPPRSDKVISSELAAKVALALEFGTLSLRRCVICGNEFRHHRKSKTCSPDCAYALTKKNGQNYRQRKAQQKRQEIPKRHCIECGGEYSPRVPWQKFCSPACADVASRTYPATLAYEEKQRRERRLRTLALQVLRARGWLSDLAIPERVKGDATI